jgi:hypothetical protein
VPFEDCGRPTDEYLATACSPVPPPRCRHNDVDPIRIVQYIVRVENVRLCSNDTLSSNVDPAIGMENATYLHQPVANRHDPFPVSTEAQPDRTAEVRDPYARWCGRGGVVRRPPIPISAT